MREEKEIVKVCKRHGHLNINDIQLIKHKKCKKGFYYTCKICNNYSKKMYATRNRKKLSENNKEYRKKNRDKYNSWARKYFKKNRSIISERANKKYNNDDFFKKRALENTKKSMKKLRENISDSYVKSLITRDSLLTSKDIPLFLVEIKRMQIILKRELKND